MVFMTPFMIPSSSLLLGCEVVWLPKSSLELFASNFSPETDKETSFDSCVSALRNEMSPSVVPPLPPLQSWACSLIVLQWWSSVESPLGRFVKNSVSALLNVGALDVLGDVL